MTLALDSIRFALVLALWSVLLTHSCAPEPVHATPQRDDLAANHNLENRPHGSDE